MNFNGILCVPPSRSGYFSEASCQQPRQHPLIRRQYEIRFEVFHSLPRCNYPSYAADDCHVARPLFKPEGSTGCIDVLKTSPFCQTLSLFKHSLTSTHLPSPEHPRRTPLSSTPTLLNRALQHPSSTCLIPRAARWRSERSVLSFETTSDTLTDLEQSRLYHLHHGTGGLGREALHRSRGHHCPPLSILPCRLFRRIQGVEGAPRSPA